ncbi:hypothetical protein K439DRAFT_1365232 [Ramaria rubella]|nr:hypothetical protein K439DRAFT_1365232 [Ramaria rubella]
MPMRWNTWYAEIDRVIKLKPAINQWIDQLDQRVTGRKKKEAACKKNDWFLTPGDWDMFDRLCGILKATLELSKTRVPTICKVLPLYKLVQEHLEAALHDLGMEHDIYGISIAVQAGLDKLEKYLDCAMDNDYVLLGAVLHPSICITYFEDLARWQPAVARHARTLLDHIYDTYAEMDDSPIIKPATPADPKHEQSSIFAQAIRSAEPKVSKSSTNELETYFSGAYPCVGEDILAWYKVC